MLYTDEQIAALRETSIAGVLADLGCRTEHTSRGMYYSPFRDERTPSFHVDDAGHRWCDFGDDGRWHDVIELVRRVRGVSFRGALDYLSSYHPSVQADIIIRESRSSGTDSTLTVLSARRPVTGEALRRYATQTRRITPAVFDRYCSQVTYRFESVDRSTGQVRSWKSSAIGFPNRGGGWSLRAVSGRRPKLSTSAGFTLIHADGTFDTGEPVTPSSRALVVFEGFFDFLSWLSMVGRTVPRDADAMVLNSVANFDRAAGVVSLYPVVWGFLDRDAAGQACTDRMAAAVAAAPKEGEAHVFEDRSAYITDGKDVSDMWMALCRRREEKAEGKAAAPAPEDPGRAGMTPSRGIR